MASEGAEVEAVHKCWCKEPRCPRAVGVVVVVVGVASCGEMWALWLCGGDGRREGCLWMWPESDDLEIESVHGVWGWRLACSGGIG